MDFSPLQRRGTAFALAALGAALLAGCASQEGAPSSPPERPEEIRARIAAMLPPDTKDRAGWATDLYAAFAAMNLDPSPANVCAAVAVAEQESGLRVDPVVPKLGEIAWAEIDKRAERVGVPRLVVYAALHLPSPTGKSWGERIDAARTERELSDVFEDFIGMVPLGRKMFGGFNPVRTGGPMQVSIAFAEKHASETPYPYPLEKGGLRREVFTRRGGLYFGVAHLLAYPAPYDQPLFRFADFNAGRYASRNAAFQNAVSLASGVPLALDGDLLRLADDADANPGQTELALRTLAGRLDLGPREIHRALEKGAEEGFGNTELYRRVFALADRAEGRPVPRAVVPRIDLHSPKITRKLTTRWFAERVDGRYRRCLERTASTQR